jgi:hypothetical protein
VRQGVLDEVRAAAGADDDHIVFFHGISCAGGGEKDDGFIVACFRGESMRGRPLHS